MYNEKKLILFDGACILCNAFVRFVIKRDQKDMFRFSTLQSRTRDASKTDSWETVLLEYKNKSYDKSTAVIKILGSLNFWWKPFYIFMLIPKILRDYIYMLIARNRYKIFGKDETCSIQDKTNSHKFV